MLRAVPRLPLPEPFLSFHKHPNSRHDEDDDDVDEDDDDVDEDDDDVNDDDCLSIYIQTSY